MKTQAANCEEVETEEEEKFFTHFKNDLKRQLRI